VAGVGQTMLLANGSLEPCVAGLFRETRWHNTHSVLSGCSNLGSSQFLARGCRPLGARLAVRVSGSDAARTGLTLENIGVRILHPSHDGLVLVVSLVVVVLISQPAVAARQTSAWPHSAAGPHPASVASQNFGCWIQNPFWCSGNRAADRSISRLSEFCSQQAGFLMHTDPEFSF
jgi:hypothetical protein